MSAPPASGPNAEQQRYWNEVAGPRWSALQERMDPQLAPIGGAALDALRVAHGERALDLGCGCGATTLELARRVGPGGSVLGVDLSEPMLARARERAAGLGQVEFRAADAQTADLGAASFDLAYSRFGVMFFADPPAAFANVRRALRPAGRLGFVCWQEMRKNPYMFEPVAAAARHVTLPPPPAPDAPGPFAFADAARVRAILERAGFGRIEIAPWAGEIGLGEPEQALEFFFEIGPLAAALREAGAGPEVHTRVREAIREVLDRYSTPAGIRMPVHTWVVTARAGE